MATPSIFENNMKRQLAGQFLCGVALLSSLSGCSVVKNATDTAKIVQDVRSLTQAQDPIVVDSVMELRKQGLMQEARDLLAAGKYAEIEKRMAQYRRSREEFLDGKSLLSAFYDGLADGGENASEAQWAQNGKRLLDWSKKQPASLTAKIALSMAYYHGAHLARGRDYGIHVKKEQWELMEKRLRLSARALPDTISSGEKCPGFFLAIQRIFFLKGIKRKDFDSVTRHGLKKYPKFTGYHVNMANYLMDRWHGEQGDWQAYAKAQADKLGGKDGDILYARLVWYMAKMVDADRAREFNNFDWPRAKRGFERLLTQPEGHAAAAPYAVAAWKQRDGDTLKHLMEQVLGNRVDFAVWTNKAQFKKARLWALEQ
jgi:hypothetical protein